MNEIDPKKEEMDLLHEEDLGPILERLGVKDRFLSEQIKCSMCDSILTPENLGSLYQEKNGDIKMICDKEECLDKLT